MLIFACITTGSIILSGLVGAVQDAFLCFWTCIAIPWLHCIIWLHNKWRCGSGRTPILTLSVSLSLSQTLIFMRTLTLPLTLRRRSVCQCTIRSIRACGTV